MTTFQIRLCVLNAVLGAICGVIFAAVVTPREVIESVVIFGVTFSVVTALSAWTYNGLKRGKKE